MRRRNNHSHDLRRAPRQIDLFTPASPGGAAGTPGWMDLPAHARETLTRLMTCLIVDHAHKGQALPGKEVSHDR